MTYKAIDADTGEFVDTGSVTVSGGVSISPNTYLGQQVITGNGANQNATLPTGTKSIWIMAEGGKVYGAINTTAAPTTAGFYVADGNLRVAGPYSGITSLGIYAASGIYAHLVYES